MYIRRFQGSFLHVGLQTFPKSVEILRFVFLSIFPAGFLGSFFKIFIFPGGSTANLSKSRFFRVPAVNARGPVFRVFRFFVYFWCFFSSF